MKLETNCHSVFSLNYHLVLVTKYRRRFIDDEISERLREIFEYIGNNYNITVDEWTHQEDHVHVLLRGHPNTNLSKFINAYKSQAAG